MKIDLDTTTMTPAAEISRLMRNARSLRVKVGGKVYAGPATLGDEDDGHLLLEFPAAKKKGKGK